MVHSEIELSVLFATYHMLPGRQEQILQISGPASCSGGWFYLKEIEMSSQTNLASQSQSHSCHFRIGNR